MEYYFDTMTDERRIYSKSVLIYMHTIHEFIHLIYLHTFFTGHQDRISRHSKITTIETSVEKARAP